MPDDIHFCAVTENMAAASAAWRKRRLAWCLAGRFPNLDEAVVRQAFAQAFGSWSEATEGALTFYEVGQADRCDVLVTTGTIDGPMGVLAWSELPPGDDRRLTQRYDTGDRYVVAVRPGQGQVDLVAVATHEIGHALGLGHTERGTGDLMEPTYEPGKRTPQPGDVRRIRSLYPAPPSPPDAGGVMKFLVALDAAGVELSRWECKRVG